MPEPDVLIHPREINADVKIVFLNGCQSAKYSDPERLDEYWGFVESFGILDQKHHGEGRQEIFIGWNTEESIWDQDRFALEFWRQLGKGTPGQEVTVETAISEAIEIVDEQHTFTNNIKLLGNSSTTLESWK